MKSVKLLTASLLAFVVVGTASAVVPTGNQVYLRYIGSTAFRAAVHKSIEDAMGGPGNYTVAFDGSNDVAKKFNAAIFYGFIGGHEVIIKTFWTGSIAGIIELAQAENLNGGVGVFPDDSNLTPLAAGAVAALPGGYAKDPTNVATVAMADNPVSEASAVLSTALNNAAKANAVAAINNAVFQDAGVLAGPGKTVALVAFQWVLSPSDDGRVPFTNITQQQAAALIKAGSLPLSEFTGLPADAFNYVFCVARNEDSGTRNAMFAESQTGFGQSCVTVQETGNPVTALAKYPITGLFLETGITWNKLGHSGYNTGGNVASALSAVMPNTAGLGAGMAANLKPSAWDRSGVGTSKAYMVSFLGISDVAGVVGGTVLTYDHVPFSANNVNTGLYTAWNYEHCYYLLNGTNQINSGDNGQPAGTARAVADAVADQMFTTDAEFDAGSGPAGVRITPSLLVTRAAGGAPVTPNF